MDSEPVQLKSNYDYHAPDNSEIYLLASGSKAGLCQCILPAYGISQAISHKTVEELWYFLEGNGEVYREGLNNDKPVAIRPGTSLVIPCQMKFQFRNTGEMPLKFLIITCPLWPGPEDAITETGIW